MIFDSHAHYDDAAFDGDREGLLRAMPSQGVCGVLNAGADLNSSEKSIALAARFPYIYAAAGIHPEAAASVGAKEMEQLALLLRQDRVVAVGEIGLDYHYEDGVPKSVQQEVFEAQIQLAQNVRLPVVIHNREAHADTLEVLRRYRPQGVLHCFSGSPEMAREVVALGLYIGIGGVVTFKNAKKMKEVAKTIPLDRLLLETDAPYLAPAPFRGKRCDSTMILDTAREIALLRGIPVEEVFAANRSNVKRLFSIG